MSKEELAAVAKGIVSPGRGILAADESFGTIKKRFTSISLESTEELRRSYRELLFTTPDVEKFISGVIMFDETIRHATPQGTPFPKLLAGKGIYPGIKVDKGTVDMTNYPGEKVTEGLDGLRQRLAEYVQLGAKFTKWRAVYTITDKLPSRANLQANAYGLAQYAALSQEAGLVPVVEPEVLMDGDHSLARCAEATTAALEAVYEALYLYGVYLEGTLLKPNMIIQGKSHATQASAKEVAAATVEVLKRTVPSAVPGIVFLSGGQTPAQATDNLNEMNKPGDLPWQLSYSYGRALQDEALKAWLGKPENIPAAQKQFSRRAKFTSLSRTGSYQPEMEKQPA